MKMKNGEQTTMILQNTGQERGEYNTSIKRFFVEHIHYCFYMRRVCLHSGKRSLPFTVSFCLWHDYIKSNDSD